MAPALVQCRNPLTGFTCSTATLSSAAECCTACQYPCFPKQTSPHRRAVGWALFCAQLVLLAAALLLLALRRKIYPMSGRSAQLLLFYSLSTVFVLLIPLKEALGDASIPCTATLWCNLLFIPCCAGMTLLRVWYTVRRVRYQQSAILSPSEPEAGTLLSVMSPVLRTMMTSTSLRNRRSRSGLSGSSTGLPLLTPMSEESPPGVLSMPTYMRAEVVEEDVDGERTDSMASHRSSSSERRLAAAAAPLAPPTVPSSPAVVALTALAAVETPPPMASAAAAGGAVGGEAKASAGDADRNGSHTSSGATSDFEQPLWSSAAIKATMRDTAVSKETLRALRSASTYVTALRFQAALLVFTQVYGTVVQSSTPSLSAGLRGCDDETAVIVLQAVIVCGVIAGLFGGLRRLRGKRVGYKLKPEFRALLIGGIVLMMMLVVVRLVLVLTTGSNSSVPYRYTLWAMVNFGMVVQVILPGLATFERPSCWRLAHRAASLRRSIMRIGGGGDPRQALLEGRMPLRLLLQSELIDPFEDFLASEFSSENVLFWKAVEVYRESSLEERHTMGVSIYVTFIDDGGDLQINISAPQRAAIADSVALGTSAPSMFDEAQEEITVLMERDPYPRFLRSERQKEKQSSSSQRCGKLSSFWDQYVG
eukprot:PLAT10801.1.p1 GENE.PLAT10801.1~~PLAT10801.1.p1  ORF type:complete len:649 (-),score=285.24 PLAT10801.1:53-1999(-)